MCRWETRCASTLWETRTTNSRQLYYSAGSTSGADGGVGRRIVTVAGKSEPENKMKGSSPYMRCEGGDIGLEKI